MEKKDKKKKEIKLRVEDAFPHDVGYHGARIDLETRTALGIEIGDSIEIEGLEKTVAVAWRGHPSEEGKKMVRIDSQTRRDAKTEVGGEVTVRKSKKEVKIDDPLKHHIKASHDEKKIVATVDKKTKKEVNELFAASSEIQGKIDALINTMGRLECQSNTLRREAWKILYKKYSLPEKKTHSYDTETGEITEKDLWWDK